MTHGGITPETFHDIAANTVKKYINEVLERTATNNSRPSYDELYSTLKTLNAELTVKAIKLIKVLNMQHINAGQKLVAEYQQIINSSVTFFVKQL